MHVFCIKDTLALCASAWNLLLRHGSLRKILFRTADNQRREWSCAMGLSAEPRFENMSKIPTIVYGRNLVICYGPREFVSALWATRGEFGYVRGDIVFCAIEVSVGTGKPQETDNIWRPAAWLKTTRAFKPLAKHRSYSAVNSAAMTAGCGGRVCSTARAPSRTTLPHVGARGEL